MIKLFGIVLMSVKKAKELSRSVAYGSQDTLGWGSRTARDFLTLVHDQDFITYSGRGECWKSEGKKFEEPGV